MSWFDWRKKFVSFYSYEVPPASLYDKIFLRLKDFVGKNIQKKMDKKMLKREVNGMEANGMEGREERERKETEERETESKGK